METNNLTKLIQIAASSVKTRLFRNNVGMGWAGRADRTQDGGVYIKDPRPLHAGLVEGSSDLIGWACIQITPEMVGREVAVFAAIEVKNGKDRLSTKQSAFIEAVKTAGGIAGVARTVEDAAEIIRQYTANP